MFRNHTILSAFLILFLSSSSLLADTAPLPPDNSSFFLLTNSLWDLDMEISTAAAANPLFHSRFTSIIGRFENGLCPPDYENLLMETNTLLDEIISSDKSLAEMEKLILKTKKELEYAEKKRKKAGMDKLRATLDSLAAARSNIENETPRLAADYTEKLKNLVDSHLANTCPPGMITIEGGFCIDKYEYPNRKDTTPAVNVSYTRAKKLCGDAGKRLCTGNEWMRACIGPACMPNKNALKPFDPAECYTGLERFPGNSPVPSGAAPVCDTVEGVADLFGNAWEWTDQDYSSRYKTIRGGSHSQDRSAGCGVSSWGEPSTAKPYFGFRCCADPAPPAPEEPAPQPATSEQAAPAAATETQNL